MTSTDKTATITFTPATLSTELARLDGRLFYGTLKFTLPGASSVTTMPITVLLGNDKVTYNISGALATIGTLQAQGTYGNVPNPISKKPPTLEAFTVGGNITSTLGGGAWVGTIAAEFFAE